MNIKLIIAALAATIAIAGCYASAGPRGVGVGFGTDVEIDGPIENGYAIGYYDPGYGYWTGTGWDVNFYSRGHRGYGHHYSRDGHSHGGHEDYRH